jgi:two-component system, LuxR family, response regulator FixJ
MAAEGQVHVIDDDDAMRDSLCFLLETSGLTARSFTSASSFLEALPTVGEGCVVTDIRMPGMSGLELVRVLRGMRPDLPVVVMTGHGDIPMAVEAMKSGVVDFLEKPFHEDAMIGAVRKALEGGRNPARASADSGPIIARMETLAPRERQVLDGLVAGKPNKVIAFDLDISVRTVEVYRANVMTKMQASSLSELVRMVMLAGG